MKRILKIVGVVVVLFVITALSVIAPAFLGRRSVPDGLEVNSIRIVKDGMVSVAVVPLVARMKTGSVAATSSTAPLAPAPATARAGRTALSYHS